MAGPPTDPSDVVNRALDYLGVEAIGDMEEGTTQARAAIRHYSPSVRDLLRAAPWNFARKTYALDLMWSVDPNDAPYFGPVPENFYYQYAYPQDAVRIRFIEAGPAQANGISGAPGTGGEITLSGDVIGSAGVLAVPPMTGLQINPFAIRQHPAPYVVAYANELAVILCNVKNAQAIYTAAVFNPATWDALFMSALVALLAGRLALAVVADKKLAFQLRAAASAETVGALNQARVADANEGVHSQDHLPDWLRIRGIQGWPIFGAMGPTLGVSYDPLALPDGSTF